MGNKKVLTLEEAEDHFDESEKPITVAKGDGQDQISKEVNSFSEAEEFFGNGTEGDDGAEDDDDES